MSATKEWLMDQVQADVDELLARVGHLEAGIAQLLRALEQVRGYVEAAHERHNTADTAQDLWVVNAAIASAKEGAK